MGSNVGLFAVEAAIFQKYAVSRTLLQSSELFDKIFLYLFAATLRLRTVAV